MKYKGSSETILHRILTVFFIMVVPLFILSHFSLLRSRRDLSCQISGDCFSTNNELQEKSFVFLLYGEGDGATYEHNLHSILSQKYDRYRIVYFLPKTEEALIEKLQLISIATGKREAISFVQLSSPLPTIDILRKAVESCKNEEVIVQLSVTDWLAHDNVLSLLNQAYNSGENIWLTYSEYLSYPSYQKGNLQPYIKRMFASYFHPKTPWLSSTFRTYYAGLFKQINPDFQVSHKKNLALDSLDLYMVPMVDNAKTHIHFIKEALYIHPEQ
jgi:hypothetical protein